MEIRENVNLAPFTTFGVGGPARWFVEAGSEADVVDAVRWARERGLAVFVLGGGSNLVVADGGFPGLVLRVVLAGIESWDEISNGGDGRVFRVGAGEGWDRFVSLAVSENCAGVECLAGIPGTVGGTPVQNVGAYGQEVAETIVGVRVMELASLEFREMTALECGFAYRQSVFNTTERGRFLVTRVDYRLQRGGEATLRYADLRKAFPVGARPGLGEVADAVREIRREKAMLLVEGDADCRSAGSFFKNPLISSEELSGLSGRLGAEPPHYPAGEGWMKLPAAWLIERAGFAKGFVLGRVGISSRHTLALVNLGGGTAADLLALRDLIVAGVQNEFGITLQMEPVLVGF